MGQDGGRFRVESGSAGRGIFFAKGLDRLLGDLPVGQIRSTRFNKSRRPVDRVTGVGCGSRSLAWWALARGGLLRVDTRNPTNGLKELLSHDMLRKVIAAGLKENA